MRNRSDPWRAVVAASTLVVALAACGSQLDPDQVTGVPGAAQPTLGAADPGAGPGRGTPPPTPGAAGGEPGPLGDDLVVGGPAGGAEPSAGSTVPGPGQQDGGGGPQDGGGGPQDGGSDGPDGNGPVGTPTDPPVGLPEGADCSGLANGTGITADSIVIGNAADISGPVPGIFASAQYAVEAFAAYFNATVPDGICGRRLEVRTYDSRSDGGADQQAYVSACDEVFAMVGSFSGFDFGGARAAQDCGLPDLRAGSVTAERSQCTTCYPALAANTDFFQNAVPDFVLENYGDAGQHAAFLYSDTGAAGQNAKAQVNAMTRRGMNFDLVQPIPVAEFDYTPYVQQMKDEKIEVVFFTTAYQFSARMRKAMQQQSYEPTLYLRDPTDYSPGYSAEGGDAVEDTVVYLNIAPFEETNKESDTYEAWLGQARPSADPEFFGSFGWSAALLFTTLASRLGGDLTRASLLDAIAEVDGWTANGLHAPQPVGARGAGECFRVLRLEQGTWRPTGGTRYTCSGTTKTN